MAPVLRIHTTFASSGFYFMQVFSSHDVRSRSSARRDCTSAPTPPFARAPAGSQRAAAMCMHSCHCASCPPGLLCVDIDTLGTKDSSLLNERKRWIVRTYATQSKVLSQSRLRGTLTYTGQATTACTIFGVLRGTSYIISHAPARTLEPLDLHAPLRLAPPSPLPQTSDIGGVKTSGERQLIVRR